MEGVASSRWVVKVSTAGARPGVFFATTSYNGGHVSNVSVFTTSNVVVSNTNADKVVLYATGTVTAYTVNASSFMLNGFGVSTGTAFAAIVDTFTSINATNGSNTTFSACVATVTATFNGGARVQLITNFSPSNNGNQQYTYATVLEDGAFLPGYSDTLGMAHNQQHSNTDNDMVLPINLTIRAPSAGSRSYCLALRGDGGQWTIGVARSVPKFGVIELGR